MTFRKISLTFLIIILGVACAYAKKEPKYEQAHQLTPEQAALVEKAIGQEKQLIKNIQLRTPLVETYIQDTRPDVKLLEVPVKRLLMGRAAQEAASRDSLANPEALDWFIDFAAKRRTPESGDTKTV